MKKKLKYWLALSKYESTVRPEVTRVFNWAINNYKDNSEWCRLSFDYEGEGCLNSINFNFVLDKNTNEIQNSRYKFSSNAQQSQLQECYLLINKYYIRCCSELTNFEDVEIALTYAERLEFEKIFKDLTIKQTTDLVVPIFGFIDTFNTRK